MSVVILGIESSCDDAGAALCIDGRVVANIVSTQLQHAQYGGVVPELASRRHQVLVPLVVKEALAQSGIPKSALTAVAFTAGPGLIGSLLVGTSFAKGLALGLGLPLVAVNHLCGHILSVFIDEPKPSFPFLCLTVSGGHTTLSVVEDYLTYQTVGTTLDDAAGEAFDKCAKLLGFPFPGGAQIDKQSVGGDPHYLPLPTPDVGGYDFSFSGLKTAFLYTLQKKVKANPNFIPEHLQDICASLQNRIVTFLLDKLFAYADKTGIKQAAVVGGVSANRALRSGFKEGCAARGMQGFIPAFEYCTDNAAMIALTGYHQFRMGQTCEHTLTPWPG